MVRHAARCGLCFGELAKLRRTDLDRLVVTVGRGVTRVDGLMIVGTRRPTTESEG